MFDTNLSRAQLNGLAVAANHFGDFVKHIILDNCQVGDGEFAQLLKAVSQITEFKSIIYRNNMFDI